MPDATALDQKIVSASVTNAALELLPESLASMAILPLQVRLVYQIGKAYGYELDQGHIKEFVATLGVGLTGQYLEQFGRKLLGGLLGTVLGGVGRGVGHQAASSGMAFATTWAIGQLAKQYYGGGRTLDAAKLKAAFAPLLEQGQGLIGKYGGEIAERARTIDVRNLPALIRARSSRAFERARRNAERERADPAFAVRPQRLRQLPASDDARARGRAGRA